MVAFFLHRLTKLLQEGHDEIIQWSEGTLHIINPTKLSKDVLPNYFGHSKYSSFILQLNSYGFFLVCKKYSNTSDYIYRNNDTTMDVNSILNLKRKRKGEKTGKPDKAKSIDSNSRPSNHFSLPKGLEKVEQVKSTEPLQHKVTSQVQPMCPIKKNVVEHNYVAVSDQYTLFKTNLNQSSEPIVPFLPLSEDSIIISQHNSSARKRLMTQSDSEQSKTMMHMTNDNEVKTELIFKNEQLFNFDSKKPEAPCPLESDTDFSNVLSSLMVADFVEESTFCSDFQDVLDALGSG